MSIKLKSLMDKVRRFTKVDSTNGLPHQPRLGGLCVPARSCILGGSTPADRRDTALPKRSR